MKRSNKLFLVLQHPGRALWSPQTAVTKPRLVIEMAHELLEHGVQILLIRKVGLLRPTQPALFERWYNYILWIFIQL